MLDNDVLKKVLQAVYDKHTGDKVCLWFCSPVDVRDSENKVLKAFTPVKLPVEYTPDSMCEILSLKAKGSGAGGGILGIVDAVQKDTIKNGFTSDNLKDLDQEYYYLTIAWAKQGIEVSVFAMPEVLANLRHIEKMYDTKVTAYNKTAIDNIGKTAQTSGDKTKPVTAFTFTIPE